MNNTISWQGASQFGIHTSSSQTGTVVGPGYTPPPPNAIVSYYPERTITYKTYLKRALRDSLNSVFSKHPDSLLQKTKVTLDNPKDEADYPAVVVKYYEGRVERTGLFNTLYETYLIDGVASALMTQESFYYWGTVEYKIYGQSSVDRDLISDTLVQVLMAGELEAWANSFSERIYTIDDTIIETELNWLVLNQGHILGFGENNAQVPWSEEDDLLYSTLHRTEVMGGFLTPPDVPTLFIQSYSLYPFVDYSLAASIPPVSVDQSGYVGFGAPPTLF